MEQFECPICNCPTEENENGNEVCFVCLREFTTNKGEFIEVQTDIYHLV